MRSLFSNEQRDEHFLGDFVTREKYTGLRLPVDQKDRSETMNITR